MKRRILLTASLLLCSLPLAAQAPESGFWRAESQTAHTITGDVALSGDRLFINLVRFTISQVRTLEPAEVSAAFNPDTPGGTANLYRVSIPADKQFLHHNTLCGSETAVWMATYAQGRSLRIIFYSSEKPPVFTIDALENSTDTCGSFGYVR